MPVKSQKEKNIDVSFSSKSPLDESGQLANPVLKKSASSDLSDLYTAGKVDFEIGGDSVGEGGYGQVFSAKTVISDNAVSVPTSPLVLKTIKNVQSTPVSEFEIHGKLTNNHPSIETGILKLISPKGVMIRCDTVFSSLCNKIRSEALHNKVFINYFVMNFIESMNRALNTLHENQVVHADIKPSNIGMRFTESGNIYFALFDLGSAKTYEQIDAGVALNGTPGYGAPESWDKEKKIIMQHKEKLDIYAVGRTLLSLFKTIRSGTFSLLEVTEQYESEKNNKKPPVDHVARLKSISSDLDFSSKLKELIAGMCEQLPENRLSLEDCTIIAKQLRTALPTLLLEDQTRLYAWYHELLNAAPTITKSSFFQAQSEQSQKKLSSAAQAKQLATNKNEEKASSAENTPLLPAGKK